MTLLHRIRNDKMHAMAGIERELVSRVSESVKIVWTHGRIGLVLYS